MPDWKKVHLNFPTVKLGQFIEPVNVRVSDNNINDFNTVYGITNTDGIVITGKITSTNVSNYIAIDKGCFVYNPYRINVGSIGYNSIGLRGCVSPAYVVFKVTKNLDPMFLFYYLKSDFGNHVINWYGNHGGVRNALSYDDLCQIDIPAINYKMQLKLTDNINRNKLLVTDLEHQFSAQLEYLNKLRQQILQEAIEGKLTDKWRKHNPDLISGENHASKLIEKIKTEKQILIKEGKIKKQKPTALITDKEKLFNLPEGWMWCRLGDVATHSLGKMLDDVKNKGSYHKYLRNLNVRWFDFNLSDLREMRFGGDEDEKYTAVKGDLLICEGGYPGRAAIWTQNNNIYIQKAIHRVRFMVQDMNRYFLYYLYLMDLNRYIEHYFTGAGIQHLTGEALHEIVFPFPPLFEQQAIVERVTNIMQMINQLEKQVSERQKLSEMLMREVLREAFSDK